MTTIQEGLVAYLAAQVPEAGNAYPLEIPQDADFPSWAYQVIDDEQLLAHSGGTGFVKCRIQIDLVVEGTAGVGAYAKAAGIAAQMRTKLDGYKGSMGGVAVKFCKTMQSDDWAEIHNLPTVTFDVLIHYRLS